MWTDELNTAIELARLAGTEIMRYYDTEIIAEEKVMPDNFAEPVTVADRLASRMIVQGISDRFRDDAVLSEEELDDQHERISRERVWIIDPIDGTAGFIKKDGDFAVQIGLAENGVPVAGVVYLPFHDLLYSASKGSGAFVSSATGEIRPLSASLQTDFSNMNLAVSRNHRSPKMSRIVEEFGVKNEVGRGSVGLKIGLIAEKVCDMYIHLSPRTKMWDTCAPQIILEESGGKLTDLFGDLYRYDRLDVQNWGGIVATNGVAHDLAIERLRPLLNEFGRLRTKSKTS
jgi:3'(2'), 5'-bisphosphate nucleotidase